MKLAGRGPFGRLATRLATWFAPPLYKRNWLADLNPQGYIAPSATIDHSNLDWEPTSLSASTLRSLKVSEGGRVKIGDRVRLHWDITVHTGQGGTVSFGSRGSVQPGCQFVAYVGSIRIGSDVHIGSNCAFYPYNHGFAPGTLIVDQPLISRGDIVLEDDVNLGVGVIVLDGVTIGKGAAVGAGSVVVQNIPPVLSQWVCRHEYLECVRTLKDQTVKPAWHIIVRKVCRSLDSGRRPLTGHPADRQRRSNS